MPLRLFSNSAHCLPTPLLLQLSYYHRLFDVEGVLHSLESTEAQAAAKEKLAPIR